MAIRLLKPRNRLFASIGSSSPKTVSNEDQALRITKSPLEVATRLAATHFLVTRWAIEMQELQIRGEGEGAKGTTTYKPADAFESLHKCLQTLPDWDRNWTEREKNLMNLPLGKWHAENELYSLDMRWESLGMLLWASKILKIVPPNDSLFDRQQIYTASAIIPAMPSTVSKFLEYFEKGHGTGHDHSISSTELLHQVNVSEAWLWRARAQKVLDLKMHFSTESSDEKENALRKEQYKQIPKSLKNVMGHIEDAIELGSNRAKEEGFISETIENDFVAFGLKYSACGDHQIRDLHRTSEARVNALGWIAGKNSWEYEEGAVNFINPIGSLWAPEGEEG